MSVLPKYKFAASVAALAILATSAQAAGPSVGAQRLQQMGPKTAADFKRIGPFDVNDISILLPLDQNQSLPIPELDVSAADATEGTRVPLLPKGTFQNVLDHAHRKNPSVNIGSLGNDLTDWRVVSLRYDSCNPGTSDQKVQGAGNKKGQTETDPNTCVQQVRLITQPFPVGKSGKREEVDTTMHLLYYVGPNRANLQTASPAFTKTPSLHNEVIRDLLAIKDASARSGADTNGQPLGIHPGLANPASRDTVAAMIKAFVRKYCTPDKLQIITYMGLPEGSNKEWIFIGGDIDVRTNPPTWIAGVMPNTRKNHFIKFTDSGNGTGVVSPTPDSPKQNQKGLDLIEEGETTDHLFTNHAALTQLKRSSTGDKISVAGTALAANNSKQLIAIANIPNLIDNPKRHKPDDTDCFSCHSTTSRQIQLRLPVQMPPSDEEEVSVFRTRGGVTGFADASFLPKANYNVRNFGYHFNFKTGKHDPTISWLTVNSTSDVAEFTNKVVFGALDPSLTKGRGVDCGVMDNNFKDLKARNCILMNALDPRVTVGACLRQAGCSNVPANVR